jgi:hypothetical protein
MAANTSKEPAASAVPRRRRWHPLIGAGGLAVAAFGVAGAGLVGSASWLALVGSWLLMGAAAGFATSGST